MCPFKFLSFRIIEKIINELFFWSAMPIEGPSRGILQEVYFHATNFFNVLFRIRELLENHFWFFLFSFALSDEGSVTSWRFGLNFNLHDPMSHLSICRLSLIEIGNICLGLWNANNFTVLDVKKRNLNLKKSISSFGLAPIWWEIVNSAVPHNSNASHCGPQFGFKRMCVFKAFFSCKHANQK